MGPSPYDIAWLARLKEPPNGEPRWPELVEWLIANQKEDGSWGGKIVYYHDRIICTLASTIALHENKHFPGAQQATRRAEQYLWHHLHMLPRDPFELVGFELIFPTLLIEARKQGLDVPNHTCGYGKIQTDKLRLIPPEMLYSPKISTVHSLEFLGEDGDVDKLRRAITHGSLGNSPAATAYYLLLAKTEDTEAISYLEGMLREAGKVVYLYPFATFELAWALNNLSFSGLPIKRFTNQQILEDLNKEINPSGVGLDPTFGIPDADTTSVSLYLLASVDYDIDSTILLRFEDKQKGFFRTYSYERNPSVSTNTHALQALRILNDYPNKQDVKDKIVLMLIASRKFNIYWVDKWHASPYYATAHTLIELLKVGDFLANICSDTVDWIVHTQNKDGSWGFFGVGTMEETAYALTTLLHYYNHYRSVDFEIVQKGADYLASNYKRDTLYPELWLGKDLYSPTDVVRSSILAALILYEEVTGRSP